LLFPILGDPSRLLKRRPPFPFAPVADGLELSLQRVPRKPQLAGELANRLPGDPPSAVGMKVASDGVGWLLSRPRRSLRPRLVSPDLSNERLHLLKQPAEAGVTALIT
jgi:hypothetical protein